MELLKLYQYFLQCDAACTDTRNISKNSMFFALKGPNFDGNTFAETALNLGAKYAVVENALYAKKPNIIVVENVLLTLQNLAAYHRKTLKTPIIALTGSNGKTTTKELINVCLSKVFKTVATKGNLNNHIGVPLTLLTLKRDTEIGIIEMGANNIGEIAFLCNIIQPDYGYITNFGKAHLEGFGSLEGVITAKSELYNFLIKHNKTIFINANDVIQVEKTKQAKTVAFSMNNNKANTCINLVNSNPYVSINYNNVVINSKLLGEFNYNNIAAAIAIAEFFKVPENNIKDAIESYVPNNNRSQIIKTASNQTLILDAYNANPTSVMAALTYFKTVSAPKTIILGDMFELGSSALAEHQNIVDTLETCPAEFIFLIGENYFKTITHASHIYKFKNFLAFKTQLDVNSLKGHTVLIKGSRGMALERILDCFKEQK